jgi:hypothetical protein
VSAAIGVQSSRPELYKEEYTQLIHILENTTKTLKQILMEHGSKCFTEADGNEKLYRDCMKRKMKEELSDYPGDNSVNAFLTEHGTANMFGGVHRASKGRKGPHVRKTRKATKMRKIQSKVPRGRKSRKATKGRKIAKGGKTRKGTQPKGLSKGHKGRKTRKSNRAVMREG